MNGTTKHAELSHGRAATDTTRLWAGRGTGQPCDLCGKVIPPEEVQYDLEVADRSSDANVSTGRIFSFHLGCYDTWRARVEKGGS